MKHQYDDYIEWIDEKLETLEELRDELWTWVKRFRASLLANKATLERHKPKPLMGGSLLPEFQCANGCGYFPCPSLLDVTNQLDEVMG